MSDRNSVPGQDDSREAVAAGSTNPNIRLPGQNAGNSGHEHEGTLASHLVYGLGTLLFVLPLCLPGMSMFWLTVVYGSIIGALAIGMVFWVLAGSLMNRRRRH